MQIDDYYPFLSTSLGLQYTLSGHAATAQSISGTCFPKCPSTFWSHIFEYHVTKLVNRADDVTFPIFFVKEKCKCLVHHSLEHRRGEVAISKSSVKIVLTSFLCHNSSLDLAVYQISLVLILFPHFPKADEFWDAQTFHHLPRFPSFFESLSHSNIIRSS